jgi:hypothetical protein
VSVSRADGLATTAHHLPTSIHSGSTFETSTQQDPGNLYALHQEITVPQDISPMQRCFAKLYSILNAPPFVNCVDILKESSEVENLQRLALKGFGEARVLPSDNPRRTTNLLQLLGQIIVGAKGTLRKMGSHTTDPLLANNVRNAGAQVDILATALRSYREKCQRRVQDPGPEPNSHTRHTADGKVQESRELQKSPLITPQDGAVGSQRVGVGQASGVTGKRKWQVDDEEEPMPGPKQDDEQIRQAERLKRTRLASLEINDTVPVKEPSHLNYRRDPLYKRPAGKDGLYRCPFKQELNCAHPPVRQKGRYMYVFLFTLSRLCFLILPSESTWISIYGRLCAYAEQASPRLGI